MVKRLGKYITLSLFFFLALILFMPKSSFYFLAEKEMQKYNLIISNEELNEKFLTLNIKHLDVSLKGVHSADIESVDIMFLALYNSIELHNIKLSSVAKSFMPTKLEYINIYYTLINPLVIKGEAKGELGSVDMEFDIVHQTLRVILKPSKIMLQKYARSLRYFKRNKKGEYVYAKAL